MRGRLASGPAFICLLISAIFVAALGPRAFGQTADADPPAGPASTQASDAPGQKASAAPNASVDSEAITQHLNQELGFDLNAKIADWRQRLNHLESDLKRPGLRYSELNAYRDELQRIRGDGKELASHLPAALDATKDNGPLRTLVLPSINDVIDLNSTHLAAARRHLPVPIMAVLLATAAISIGIIGFGNGRVGRRFSVLDSVYGIVLAAALWMTVDLDYPRFGFIRVSNLPLVETLAAMN